MNLLHYNILNGCQQEPDRWQALAAWLQHQDADIVGLNELNGWPGSPGIQARANDAGYAHATLYETDDSVHFVGVFSRSPHQVVLATEDGFHHGVLAIHSQGITIICTHLTPISAADRRQETKRLADLIGSIDGPVLLMGDLNTLSPLDADYLAQPEVIRRLQGAELLTRKFLQPSGAPDFQPMETLLAAGLTDLGAEQPERHSVPTPFNRDHAHALPLRLDYMLGNEAFCAAYPGRAEVIRQPATDHLSDHYPVAFTPSNGS